MANDEMIQTDRTIKRNANVIRQTSTAIVINDLQQRKQFTIFREIIAADILMQPKWPFLLHEPISKVQPIRTLHNAPAGKWFDIFISGANVRYAGIGMRTRHDLTNGRRTRIVHGCANRPVSKTRQPVDDLSRRIYNNFTDFAGESNGIGMGVGAGSV